MLLFLLNPLSYSSSPFIMALVVLINLTMSDSFTFIVSRTKQVSTLPFTIAGELNQPLPFTQFNYRP